jgi:hypothetical protein
MVCLPALDFLSLPNVTFLTAFKDNSSLVKPDQVVGVNSSECKAQQPEAATPSSQGNGSSLPIRTRCGPRPRSPYKPVNTFKIFSAVEKMKAQQHQRSLALRDKTANLAELKKFAETFKLSTVPTPDVISILAKDKKKQQEIVEKAKREAKEVQNAKMIREEALAVALKEIAEEEKTKIEAARRTLTGRQDSTHRHLEGDQAVQLDDLEELNEDTESEDDDNVADIRIQHIDGDMNHTVSDNFRGTISGNMNGTVKGTLTGNILGSMNGLIEGCLVGDVLGNVNGRIMGDVVGNVLGNVTGRIEGFVTGNVMGNVTGVIVGEVKGDVLGLC